jgi:hypothetical protein
VPHGLQLVIAAGLDSSQGIHDTAVKRERWWGKLLHEWWKICGPRGLCKQLAKQVQAARPSRPTQQLSQVALSFQQ